MAVDTDKPGSAKSSQKPYLAGLKVGLEIHQQLAGKKLFCNCKAEIIERQPDFSFSRELRAIAGETGAIDKAAAAEQAKSKSYSYNCYNEATCLVELDEEPPHPINPESVITGIMVAKAFKSTILPRMQVMRKTVVDGSAVSAFQRTGLFAFGGNVPELPDNSIVRIQTVCIEEDAAKIITRGANEDVYNLSRLGIALLEIATEPDITTPQQAQDVAAQIGMVLRSTKRVKRGLGTIRQDVNVSIPGGSRVEIKGCQDLRSMPQIIEYEALRQSSLLKLKSELSAISSKRKIATLSSTDAIDVTDAFRASNVSFIKQSVAKGDRVLLLKVPDFAGILGGELCPNYRVGSELADLARSRGFGGMIHSDEDLAKYGLKGEAGDALKRRHSGPKDGFVILIGEQKRIESALDDLIIPRMASLFDGIPAEVRKANADCTTSYQRPMPGSARMYPETDIPIVDIDESKVSAPKLLSEQIQDLVRKYAISEDQAKQIVREGLPYDEWLTRYANVEPTFLATAMLTYGKEILARYKKEIDHITLLEPLLLALDQKRIPKSAVFELLVEIAEGKTSPDDIDYSRFAGMSGDELESIVKSELKKNPDLTSSALMGNVMAKVRGKADGKQVMEMIMKMKADVKGA